jgi:hypothetical protein
MDEARPTPRTPREALLMILAELGKPGSDMPAPVGNCVEIAEEGLKPIALETFDENDRLKDYLATAHVTLEAVEKASESLPVEVRNAVRASRALPPDIEAVIDMRRHRGA